MVMLDLFTKAAADLQMDIAVAYVDHKLRSSDITDREALLVRKAAEKTGRTFRKLSFDSTFWNTTDSNKEERARTERYRLLALCAQELGAAAVATAHHMDDQIETLLMRLFDRKGSITALGGIRRKTVIADMTVIRPLLSFSKEAITKYVAKNGILFTEDLSNHDQSIRRNFYRHSLIPLLIELLGKHSVRHLADIADNISNFNEFQKYTSALFWQKYQIDTHKYVVPLSECRQFNVNFWATALHELTTTVNTQKRLPKEAFFDCAFFILKQEKPLCTAFPFVITRTKSTMIIEIVSKIK